MVVLGVNTSGYRSILSIEPGYKDDAECWRTVFKELKARGVDSKKVRIGIMDGLPGLERVFREEFPHAVTQRCWVHALKNALNKCTKRSREAFKKLADEVQYASSQNAARAAFSKLKEVMAGEAKNAVHCLEKDLESLLAHYAFEKSYWRALRTTNPIERVNKEFTEHPEYANDVAAQKRNIPYIGEVLLGHVRYGTFGKRIVNSLLNYYDHEIVIAGRSKEKLAKAKHMLRVSFGKLVQIVEIDVLAPKLVETLKEVGYDGALSVEFCPPLDRTPANPHPGSIDTNPVGLSAEQKKFLEDHGSSALTEEFYSMLTQKSFDTLCELI